MRTVAIVQARLNSMRLPGKVLRDICGKPMLLHVLERVAQAKLVDQVVVATVHGNSGGPIAGRCDDWGVGCYQDPGDENDVLGRMAKAAGIFEADRIVRVCGDNPLICPGSIDRLVAESNEYPAADYVGFKMASLDPEVIDPAVRHPTGYFAEVMTREALGRADREATERNDREHVTQYIYGKYSESEFCCRMLPMPKWYRDAKPINVAVKTEEDLERVAELIGDISDAPPLPHEQE